MKITRNSVKIVFVGLLCLCLGDAVRVAAEQLYAPDLLWARRIAEKTDPVDIADTHLNIPYREDGALDDRGYFTTFANPGQLLDQPGLNCSGLVVSVSRFLVNKNWRLDEVTHDRLGNSGAGASLGKDWDFGWDLIFNIADGRQPRVIMPEGALQPPPGADGTTLRGFDMHDTPAWQRVLAQMEPGKVYLGSISKPSAEPGYKLLHYHVVLMIPDGKGNIFLYHATQRSRVHKINVAQPQGLTRFMGQFGRGRREPKHILVVEALLPSLDDTSQTAADTGAGPVPDASGPTGAGHVPADSLRGDLTGGAQASPPQPQETGQQTPLPEAAPEQVPAIPVSLEKPAGPNLVIDHLSGKVYRSIPEMVTHIPKFADDSKTALQFWVRNTTQSPRNIEIFLRGPGGDENYKGQVPAAGQDLVVLYPQDFKTGGTGVLKNGEYLAFLRVDGNDWCANLFEVGAPREAEPKIVAVKVPATVQASQTFTVKIEAKNQGAESDYGGITVSSPDPSGLRIVSAKPGKLFAPGSTVLSVTTDRIRTRVPMAERWIELWGEDRSYDMEVTVRAGRPGTYPLYVRSALRGVNVKSSVVLMDPSTAQAVDQQGFPVYVHQITVR